MAGTNNWGKGIAITVFMLLFCGFFVFLAIQCGAEHHRQYATGEEYTIAGYVTEATETERQSKYDSHKRYVHDVTLTMEEPLPNGSTEYNSGEKSVYDAVKQFADEPDRLIYFKIDKDGYVTASSATPFTENSDGGNDEIDWGLDKTGNSSNASNSSSDNVSNASSGTSNSYHVEYDPVTGEKKRDAAKLQRNKNEGSE